MSGSSPWNTSGFASPPNTNVLDENSMPSDKAQAARDRAKEIMDASRNGKPGDADRMMGEREPKGTAGLLPIDWMKSKFGRSKKGKGGKEEKGDGVVR